MIPLFRVQRAGIRRTRESLGFPFLHVSATAPPPTLTRGFRFGMFRVDEVAFLYRLLMVYERVRFEKMLSSTHFPSTAAAGCQQNGHDCGGEVWRVGSARGPVCQFEGRLRGERG